MAKRQMIKQKTHIWAVYHIKETPAKLVGMVCDQPDADAAIKQAIVEYNVPLYERGRLIGYGGIDRRQWRWKVDADQDPRRGGQADLGRDPGRRSAGQPLERGALARGRDRDRVP